MHLFCDTFLNPMRLAGGLLGIPTIMQLNQLPTQLTHTPACYDFNFVSDFAFVVSFRLRFGALLIPSILAPRPTKEMMLFARDFISLCKAKPMMLATNHARGVNPVSFRSALSNGVRLSVTK